MSDQRLPEFVPNSKLSKCLSEKRLSEYGPYKRQFECVSGKRLSPKCVSDNLLCERVRVCLSKGLSELVSDQRLSEYVS